jgi:hypothetical protein
MSAHGALVSASPANDERREAGRDRTALVKESHPPNVPQALICPFYVKLPRRTKINPLHWNSQIRPSTPPPLPVPDHWLRTNEVHILCARIVSRRTVRQGKLSWGLGMAKHREQLLRIGHEILDPLYPQPARMRVHLQKGGAEFRLLEESTEMEAPMETQGDSPPGLPMKPEGWPDWLPLLIEAEERLLRVADDEWRPASELARRALVRPGGDLLPLLRRLCTAGMMEAAQGKGFRLSQPPRGQKRPAFWGSGLLPTQQHEIEVSAESPR